MRIVSLVPSATETLFALGVGDDVTAVTHECDHPPEALELPKVTRDVIGPGLPPDEVDRAVRELTEQGRAIYELDEHALHSLAPDLIVTQALCAVCAVSIDVAGHWTPQLIEYAGGIDLLGLPGEGSETRTWEEVAAAEPEVVVCMPCGYDAERALEEAETFSDELAEVGARRVVAVDAAAYFSRPGPRLVDGLELLAHILHPDRVPEAPGEVLEVYL